MKQCLACVFLICTLVAFSSCRKEPTLFSENSPWIGLWESQSDALEIWQNGTGEWFTNRPRRELDRKKQTPALVKHKFREFYGTITIENGELWLGIYRAKKFNQVFKIDQFPTDGIDDQGNSYTYIVLDGEILKKTY